MYEWIDRNWNRLALTLSGFLAFFIVIQKLTGFNIGFSRTQTCIWVLLPILSIFWRKVPRIPEKIAYPVCLCALSFPFFCFVFGALGFLVGIPLTKWHGVLALAVSLGILWKTSKSSKFFILNTILFLFLTGGCIFINTLAWDTSADGILYHKPAEILLSDGWNPVFQPELKDFLAKKHMQEVELNYSHAAYFPKGKWIVSAIFYQMTGWLDAGDSLNLILFFCALILGFHLLKELFPLSELDLLLVSTALALNMYVTEEVFCGMIDFLLGTVFLLFFLSSLVWIQKRDSRWLPILLGTAIFGCTLKHTAPVYFGVTAFFLLLYSLRSTRSETHKILGNTYFSWLFLIAFGVILTGWNPFITNTWNHTSPFYPLHSFALEREPTEDILAPAYGWTEFHNATRFQRFVYKFFVNPDSPWAMNPENVPLPEMYTFENYHLLNNFMLVTSCFLVFFLPRRWLFLIGILFLTVLIQPHNWWNRFVPQLWMIPILIFTVLCVQWKDISTLGVRMKWFTRFCLAGICLYGTDSMLQSLRDECINTIVFSQLNTIFQTKECNVYAAVIKNTSNLPPNTAEVQFRSCYNVYIKTLAAQNDWKVFVECGSKPYEQGEISGTNIYICNPLFLIFRTSDSKLESPYLQQMNGLNYFGEPSVVHLKQFPECFCRQMKTNWRLLRDRWFPSAS